MTEEHAGFIDTLALAESSGWEVLTVSPLACVAADSPGWASGEFAQYDEQVEADQWCRDHDSVDAAAPAYAAMQHLTQSPGPADDDS